MSEVSPYELWLLSLSTMRYAHGRMSAIPSEITEFIVRHFEDFTIEQIGQFANETEAELDRAHHLNEYLGMDCDDDVWRVFVKKCREEINRRLDRA
jgi:hypothetical protein